MHFTKVVAFMLECINYLDLIETHTRTLIDSEVEVAYRVMHMRLVV